MMMRQFYALIGLMATLWLVPASADVGERLTCEFKAAGKKAFSRPSQDADFLDEDGRRFDTLENEAFWQLRSAEIATDNVNNPFTVYMIDKKTKRIRQISGAMRAAPMMSDGICRIDAP